MNAETCNKLALALQDYDLLKDYISGKKPLIDSDLEFNEKSEKLIGELNLFEKFLCSAIIGELIDVSDPIFSIFVQFINYRLKRHRNAEIWIRKGFKIVESKNGIPKIN